MVKPMRVAILLATYNGINYIDEQIRSICAQTHGSWHIFLRDDGSTDGTVAFVQTIVPADCLTIIDPTREKGGSPSRNFFALLKEIDLDQFGYVALCDQDDVWAPRKLARAIECLNETRSAGYSCNLIPFDNALGKAWFLKKDYPEKEFDYIFQGASAGCTYVINQEYGRILQAKLSQILKNPPLGFSHDWTIYAICRSLGLKWYQDAHAYIFYRQHSLNIFGALPSYKGLLTRLALARSGWYRANILWLGTLLAGGGEERAVLDRIERFHLADRFWLVRHRKRLRRHDKDAFFFAIIAVLGFL